jgi:hypothetical protein
MRKQYSTVLFMLVCICGLASGAHAQAKDVVVAKVPYDFVVGGQVLPAGTYEVSRASVFGGPGELEISSYENGASTLLIPTFFDDLQTGHAQLTFEHVGDEYFLSGIETPSGRYTITVPGSASRVAQMEQKGSATSRSTNPADGPGEVFGPVRGK